MSNELSVIDTNVLTNEEKTELDKNLERIIAEHKNNRQEINRLVFESVAAMTEADDAESELSNKGFFQRLIGGITGSNQKLQNKINSNRAAAQYASQQTLQKLAEQNLMSFDLITAVNNKLNASVNAVNDEFKNIYSGLSKFLKYNRNELARIEARLSKVEQNVNLLTWQNSIEYQDFDGEEYSDMDNTKKIVCLVRDFYEITHGNWSTSDLLLLKTAMSTIGIQPKETVNYYNVLSDINRNHQLRNKLLGDVDIRPIEDPSYLISMGTLEKLNSLDTKDSYIVDTIIDFIAHDNPQVNRDGVCDQLTKNYLRNKAMVNVDIEVESYDLILDLLYNIKQAEAENILLISSSEHDNLLKEAEELFIHGKVEETLEKFNFLAQNGNSKAMFFLGELYSWALPKEKINKKIADEWIKKGAELNDVLCRLKLADCTNINDEEKEKIVASVMEELISLANSGDIYAQDALGTINYEKNNYEMAIKWYKPAAAKGFYVAMYNLGNAYYNMGDYSNAKQWYQLAADIGYDWAYHNLGILYDNGESIFADKNKAIEFFKKAFELNGGAAGQSANYIGSIHYHKGEYLEAKKWFQLAGEAGYDLGWHNLGNYYRDKDEEKAIEFYKKSYDMKGEYAGQNANNIGLIYYNKGDYISANKWYQLAGEAGYDFGWSNLAYNHLWGNGFTNDSNKAIYYYKKAYEMDGEAAGNAAFQIGSIYENGGNYNEAKKWYKLAANAGDANAQSALSNLLW